jgi:type IV pilus assembly protein PilX
MRLSLRDGERGVALVCALVLMLATMVIGLAATRGAFGAVAAARNERDREVAWAAAEAALRDAELDIAGTAAPASARAAQFSAAGADAFTDGCGRGTSNLGLCRVTAPPAWQRIDLADAAQPALVAYGRFTDATLLVGQGLAPARLPAYLIERLEPAGVTSAQGTFYRISAIGFGLRAATHVVLQGVYRKPAPDGGGAADGAGTGTGDAAPAGGAGAGAGTTTDGGSGAPAGAGPGAAPAPDGGPDGDPASGPAGGNAGRPTGDPDTGSAQGRPQPAQPPPTSSPTSSPHQLPAGRIGWREIVNWSELHARIRD